MAEYPDVGISDDVEFTRFLIEKKAGKGEEAHLLFGDRTKKVVALGEQSELSPPRATEA